MKSFVRIVIKDSCGRYLLLHEVKKEKRYDAWNFAGGKVESNELPEVAAKRELCEELGVETSNLKLIKIMKIMFSQEEHIGYFFELNKDFSNFTIKEPDKCLDAKFFTVDKMKDLKLSKSVTYFLEIKNNFS